MVKIFRLALVPVMACLLCGCQKANDDLDTFRVAALVGDERLSHDTLLSALGITREEAPYHFELYLKALDDYINFILIRQEFERRGMDVSREMLDEALEGAIRKAGSPEALEEQYRQRHWTRQYLEDSLKADVAADILVTRFPELTRQDKTPEAKARENMAHSRQVRELLLKKDSKREPAAAEQTARHLFEYVQSGVSLEVAASVSSCELLEYRVSSQNGTLEPSSRVARLSLLTAAEIAGEDPLLKFASSQDGWHILRVAPMAGKTQKLEDQKAQERVNLEKGRKILAQNLRKNNFIEILQQPVLPIDKLPENRN